VIAKPYPIGIFGHEKQGNTAPEERGPVARYLTFRHLISQQTLLTWSLELVELFGIRRQSA